MKLDGSMPAFTQALVKGAHKETPAPPPPPPIETSVGPVTKPEVTPEIKPPAPTPTPPTAGSDFIPLKVAPPGN